jgi:hypothetical protein
VNLVVNIHKESSLFKNVQYGIGPSYYTKFWYNFDPTVIIPAWILLCKMKSSELSIGRTKTIY